MQQQVLVFPVVAGKTDDDAHIIGDEFAKRVDEYRESRDRLGIALERAYLQKTPMGSFVVVYGESRDGFDTATAGMVQSDLAIDKFFVDSVREIHGFDMTQPPPGPSPETIGMWNDPDVTVRKPGFAFCAPLLPDTEEAGRAFTTQAFGSDDMARTRRAMGISKEIVTLLKTPAGDLIAVYLEGDDPVAANAEFAASDDPFNVWFKGELAKLFPPFVDFNQPVPPVTEIFDSLALA